jgi:flagellar motility protein MotE (MotC chaperone)
MNDMLMAVFLAAIGGSGVVGFVFFLIRRWLEGKLSAIERQKETARQNRKLRAKLEDELHQAQGRVLSWLIGVVTPGERSEEQNKGLQESFQDLKEVEKKIREFEREILYRE